MGGRVWKFRDIFHYGSQVYECYAYLQYIKGISKGENVYVQNGCIQVTKLIGPVVIVTTYDRDRYGRYDRGSFAYFRCLFV